MNKLEQIDNIIAQCVSWDIERPIPGHYTLEEDLLLDHLDILEIVMDCEDLFNMNIRDELWEGNLELTVDQFRKLFGA